MKPSTGPTARQEQDRAGRLLPALCFCCVLLMCTFAPLYSMYSFSTLSGSAVLKGTQHVICLPVHTRQGRCGICQRQRCDHGHCPRQCVYILILVPPPPPRPPRHSPALAAALAWLPLPSPGERPAAPAGQQQQQLALQRSGPAAAGLAGTHPARSVSLAPQSA